MASKGRVRVLYFIRDTNPTDEQRAEAKAMGDGVAFRNSRLVPSDGPLEHADIVAGDVPDVYRAAYDNPTKFANAFGRGSPIGPVAQSQTALDAATNDVALSQPVTPEQTKDRDNNPMNRNPNAGRFDRVHGDPVAPQGALPGTQTGDKPAATGAGDPASHDAWGKPAGKPGAKGKGGE